MVLDACVIGDAAVDAELTGGRHAELMRVALTLSTAGAGRDVELIVDDGAGWYSVLRSVSDPLGEPLVLSAVVQGTARQCDRIRRRLREVPADALVDGPSLRRRPVDGRWALGGAPPVPQQPEPTHPEPPHPESTQPVLAHPVLVQPVLVQPVLVQPASVQPVSTPPPTPDETLRAMLPGPLSALPAGASPLLQEQVPATDPDLGQPAVVLR